MTPATAGCAARARTQPMRAAPARMQHPALRPLHLRLSGAASLTGPQPAGKMGAKGLRPASPPWLRWSPSRLPLSQGPEELVGLHVMQGAQCTIQQLHVDTVCCHDQRLPVIRLLHGTPHMGAGKSNTMVSRGGPVSGQRSHEQDSLTGHQHAGGNKPSKHHSSQQPSGRRPLLTQEQVQLCSSAALHTALHARRPPKAPHRESAELQELHAPGR